MKELIKMFYPDVERGTFPVENLNTIPASAFFSCASTATGAPNASHDWIGLQINNEADENSAVQMAFSVDSTDRYERKRTAGAWSAWVTTPAAQVGVTDTANYFTGTTVEAALAEVGAALALLATKVKEKTDYGVLSGLVTSAQGTPDMTVSVSAGVVYLADGTRLAPVAVAALAVAAADATNPRIDLVYITPGGTVTCLSGTAAAEPAAPATPDGALALAEIAVAAEATTVVTGNITDKRRTLATA